MRARPLKPNVYSHSSRSFFRLVAAAALLLALAPVARAQSVDFDPAALIKQRAAILLKATHATIADLENDVNHLAVLSETCRVEHGAQACGLSDKPLESSKLEDRYAYYVKQPVEAHSKGQGVKVQRRNWQGSSAPPKAVTSDPQRRDE